MYSPVLAFFSVYIVHQGKSQIYNTLTNSSDMGDEKELTYDMNHLSIENEAVNKSMGEIERRACFSPLLIV